MNPFPDYSAAYVVLQASDGTEGHALAFTVGRGTEVQVAGVRAHAPLVVGQDVDEVLADLGGFGRRLTGDSQLRWLGPQKGVIQMAAGALVNAAWDLRATREGKPLWRLLADLPAQELVSLVDFRYLRDALTPSEALDLLGTARAGRQERERILLERGYPAYTTTPGWLGYDDEKLSRLSKEAVAEGFGMIKIKVGAELDSDVRRLAVARQAVGPTFPIAVDANQIWGVDEAIEWIRALAPFDPYWIEEPTSPDDILGHQRVRSAVAPIRVATGEHGQNPVLFKQLLQAGGIDVLQLDATRVAGVNDNVANLLLAARFGVPVCPHAGGVGLCEMVQHLAMFDYLAVSGSVDGRMVEYVDHLHEHFTEPGRRVRRTRHPTASSADRSTRPVRGTSVTTLPSTRTKPGSANPMTDRLGRDPVRKSILTVCAFTAVATLAACGGGSSSATNSSSAGASGAALIGLDYPRSDTDFWNAYIRYAPQKAKSLGITNLKTTNSENDVAKLASNVQTLLSQGAKGIVMAPQDTAAIAPTLAQLQTKKIPVVTIDTRPDTGNVYMVVRADNRAYGEKACQFLGTKLGGKGSVVMLEGDVASINGRDRTDAFNECMKTNFSGITVYGEPSKWDGGLAASQLQTVLAAHPDVKGVYMESSFALAGTLQVLNQKGLLVAPTDPKHVFIVSNDGIPEELKDIAAGKIDATVSQPADLYAQYGLYYVQQALAGKTFQPGKTDHDSTIIQVRAGLLEDQLSAPLVTVDGATINGATTLKSTDTSLWGNNVS